MAAGAVRPGRLAPAVLQDGSTAWSFNKDSPQSSGSKHSSWHDDFLLISYDIKHSEKQRSELPQDHSLWG